MIYAPRLKDFVLSLGGFVVVVVVLFLFFCLTCKEKFCLGHSWEF